MSNVRGEGGLGGHSPPPPVCNLPKMTLFSSLLPPKTISCGFSILCVGEEAFTHLFVLQRRLSFALLCFLAFLLPSEYVWISPSCLSVRTLLTPCSVFVWFSPSCVLEKTCLFISSRLKRAGGPPPICNEGAPFEEGFEGDFARDFHLRGGEDIFIVLIMAMV